MSSTDKNTPGRRKKSITPEVQEKMKQIGRRIVDFRIERNLSQKELMDYLNKDESKKIAQTKMSNAEIGFSKKGQDLVVARICKKFDLSKSTFYPDNNNYTNEEILSKLQQSEEKNQQLEKDLKRTEENLKILKQYIKLNLDLLEKNLPNIRNKDVKANLTTFAKNLRELY